MMGDAALLWPFIGLGMDLEFYTPFENLSVSLNCKCTDALARRSSVSRTLVFGVSPGCRIGRNRALFDCKPWLKCLKPAIDPASIALVALPKALTQNVFLVGDVNAIDHEEKDPGNEKER